MMSESRIERSRLPPVAWFFIIVIGLFTILNLALSIYEGFSDPIAWKDLALSLVQSCFVASLVCYFSSGRGIDGEVPDEVRDRAIDRVVRASQKGIPWYIAPVVWVPVSMLSIIWYFAG